MNLIQLIHLVPANKLSLRRGTDPTGLPGATTDNTLMHSCLDAVVHLKVELGKLVLLVRGGFLDISERRGIDDITNDEALDSLVLRNRLAGGGTSVK